MVGSSYLRTPSVRYFLSLPVEQALACVKLANGKSDVRRRGGQATRPNMCQQMPKMPPTRPDPAVY